MAFVSEALKINDLGDIFSHTTLDIKNTNEGEASAFHYHHFILFRTWQLSIQPDLSAE